MIFKFMLGILIVAVGLFFLLKNLGLITGDLWNIIWPIIVITIGLKILLFKRNHCCGWRWFGEKIYEKFREKKE